MDMLVETVRSCHILDQIICSNAEKRYMFGKLIRNPNCRRSFYNKNQLSRNPKAKTVKV